jgi:hypothetical protein
MEFLSRPKFNLFQAWVMSIPNMPFAHVRGGNHFYKFQVLEGIFNDKIQRIDTMPLLLMKQDKNEYYLCRAVYELPGGSFEGEIRWKIIDGAGLSGTAKAAFASGCRPKTAEKR